MKNFLQESLGREREACAFRSARDAVEHFCTTDLAGAAGKNRAQVERAVAGRLLAMGRDKPRYRTGHGKRLNKFSRRQWMPRAQSDKRICRMSP